MKHNEFEKEEKYKLYRSVREILHPTISKKNISNYKIIVGEEYIPLRVYYPKKVSNISNIIIYIHGDSNITSCEEKYSDISQTFAKELDNLVISIDYNEKEKNLMKLYEEIYKTFEYVYEGLLRVEIEKKSITIVGDSTGSNIILGLLDKINKLGVERLILFYPILSNRCFKNNVKVDDKTPINNDLIKRLNAYYKELSKNKDNLDLLFPIDNKELSLPETLVISGKLDPLKEEVQELLNKNNNLSMSIVPFADHGFLNTKDKEIIKEYITIMKKFIKESNN